MNIHSHPRKYALLVVIVIMLGSMACSLSDRNDTAELQSTLFVMEMTKTYLESQTTQIPPQEVDPGEVDVQLPTIELPPAVEPPPVIDPTPEPIIEPDVLYEGISFSFHSVIADSVLSATIPGQNLGDDFFPSETYPTHYEFSFNRYAVGDHFHEPKILIYPVEDFRSISGFAHDQFNLLDAALVNRPGGSSMSNLPFLPLWPAAQIFSAQVSYFDFQNGAGVRYLTMFGQDIYPVDNTNLIYTYQGMTRDGRYYISAVFPVTHLGLPDDGSDLIGEDYSAFYSNWDGYIAGTMRFLGEQPPDSYTPSIQLLDEMIVSVEINR